ncbi:MAG TPA: citrate lyase acyl carrier protein [Eubacteriales bacterium]|nr:citrate lyase acyl carrier protein [Clostridia bacterium]HRV72403.1 citrate lyase acyl carrier protein [Eubacteriales bacterium]
MQLIKNGICGTMESSDIMIRIEPRDNGGIEIQLSSSVMQQFGKQIEKVIRETLTDLDVVNAFVKADDKGALDCTIRARVNTAAYRAAESTDYVWRTKE